MGSYITSITQAIGKTPLLRLGWIKTHLGFGGEAFAKLEHLNPSFSKKDRIALGMIELAEQKGLLKPGQPVLDMTSGNTGTGGTFAGYIKALKRSSGGLVRCYAVEPYGCADYKGEIIPGAMQGI